MRWEFKRFFNFFLTPIFFCFKVQTYVSLCQTRLPNHSNGSSLKPNTPGRNINSSSDVRVQNNELQVTIRACSTLVSSPGLEPLSTTSLSGALSAKPSMLLSGLLTHFIISEQQFDHTFRQTDQIATCLSSTDFHSAPSTRRG